MDLLGLVSGKATDADTSAHDLKSAVSSSPDILASSAGSEADAPVIYGRVDAENEDNLELISSVAEHGRRAKLTRPSLASAQAAQRHRDDAIMQGTATSSHLFFFPVALPCHTKRKKSAGSSLASAPDIIRFFFYFSLLKQ